MPEKPGFLAELKRRNVLRAGALYVAAVWALAQGISQLSGPFGLANGVTVWFVIACAIAFPLWMAFAWFYEFTRQGIKRESEVPPGESITHSTARKLDFAIIAVLAVAVALLGWRLLVVSREKAPALATTGKPALVSRVAPAPFNPPPGTLVVLPFTNLNGEASQQYFSDGITEELTNALGQNTALTVIAWDTASHYRNSRETPAAIGRELNVANLLNGTIEREGSEVRVLAELVNTRTGAQIWSDHYDASLANVFEVQDQITAAIAGALKVKFASLGAAPTVNPQAYDLVLQARALLDKSRSAAPIEHARQLLEQAIAIDPDYADAHAAMAGALYVLTEYSTLPLKDVLPKLREEAHKALALDPRNVEALVELANADAAQGKLAEAGAGYERALAIDPSNAQAHLDYGTLLPPKQALAQEVEAVQIDPDNAAAKNDLVVSYTDLGEYEQALAPMLSLVRMDPHGATNAFGLAWVYSLLHRNEDAVKAFDLAQPNTELARALIAAGRLAYQSVLNPELHAKALVAVNALQRRADLDPYSMVDVMLLDIVLGQNSSALDLLTRICVAGPVGCRNLGISPLYQTLHGDPHFEALVKQYDTVSKPSASASAP